MEWAGLMTSAEIDARRRWNDTGLGIRANTTYGIAAMPGQRWVDGFISCGPEGYSRWWLKPFTVLRRVRSAPWFSLIGAVGRASPLLVGDQTVFHAEIDGELSFYANDIIFMYWNNRGSIRVAVAESPTSPKDLWEGFRLTGHEETPELVPGADAGAAVEELRTSKWWQCRQRHREVRRPSH